jgi:hypothetical protein
VAVFAIEEERADAERAGAIDVVLQSAAKTTTRRQRGSG